MARLDSDAPRLTVRVGPGLAPASCASRAVDAGTIRQVQVTLNGRRLGAVRRPVVGVRLLGGRGGTTDGDGRGHGRQRRRPRTITVARRGEARAAPDRGRARGRRVAVAAARPSPARPPRPRSRSTRGPGRSTRVAAGLAKGGPEGPAPRGPPPPGGGRTPPGRAPWPASPGSPARARPPRPSATTSQVSQGIERTGADVLGRVADGGAGLTIAVLDLGFGQNLARLQTLGEIPPPEQVETLSFDAANGLAGRNAYGNRTNHGEIVAQTVFDYAPKARYLFVNYHTEADFLAATDALIARRPDIVVHSNSFIEGPFDGTGPLARAVNRAAAAGHPLVQLGRQLRAAPLERAVGRRRRRRRPRLAERRQLDVPALGRPADHVRALVDLARRAGRPPTSTSSLERREADRRLDRRWRPRPTASPPALPHGRAHHRLLARRSAGELPPAGASASPGRRPAGDLTLFSREIPLAAIGGLPVQQRPDPGRRRRSDRDRRGRLARQRAQVVLVPGPDRRRTAEARAGRAHRHAHHGPRRARARSAAPRTPRPTRRARPRCCWPPSGAPGAGRARPRSAGRSRRARSTSASPGPTRCSASAACG